jgi:uncharacterized membrane protein YjdF
MKWLIRGALAITLLVYLYNGLLAAKPQLSQFSGWGELWQGQVLTVVAVWAILEISNLIAQKTKLGGLPNYAWILAGGINGVDFVANVFLLFEIPQFDKIVHFSTGIAGGLLFLMLIRWAFKKHEIRLPKFWIYLLTIATVNLLAVIYEIIELVGDKYFGAFNITDKFDTTEDLLLDMLGVSVVIAADLIIGKIKKSA